MKIHSTIRISILLSLSALFIQSCSLHVKQEPLQTDIVTTQSQTQLIKPKPLAIVEIETGAIKGIESADHVAFLGIPYAQAPVKALRWTAPKPYKQWKGIKNTSKFGADCMQLPFPGDAAPLTGTVSEDCLFINVWKPKQAEGKKLPVMVWIHGGGFVNGGTSPDIYSGEAFANSGVILVSFNYRLGRFGFFAHPALSTENDANVLGNYGFMDQIAALKWVQQNISNFGGDANNVTLFGESAGGRSVNALMLSPLAKGLFHKAIAQSGGGRSSKVSPDLYLNKNVLNKLTQVNQQTQYAEDYGIAFAKSVGVEGSDEKALKQLRSLPADKVVNGLNLSTMNNVMTYSGPMIDGQLVVESDEEGFSKGHQMKIPHIVGANELEWGFLDDFAPQAAKGISGKALEKAGDRRKQFMNAYQPHLIRGNKNTRDIDLALLGSMIHGDIAFVEPSRYVARKLAENSQPVWLYRFSYVPTHLVNKVKGAYHATEIPFVFNTANQQYGTYFTAQDQKVADIMHNYWVNFAKSGKPTAINQPVWQSYNQQSEQVIEFNTQGAEAKKDPLFERLNELELTL
ncbi:carboxylesterase family protein [Pseudocolwellia sp. AS88]|uniref:carboxylesterase/lipase family protein n=1 Tax=Pseudocolwellia sp. AS88 TaxID=3063958 RepID=UPI0026EE50F3|nr:carboxylesterase family protein [Pseudocolwellia sp. AS88]MDO7086382.1 carboxylesterase family protein [Pseudocolwellia sp. AS88]